MSDLLKKVSLLQAGVRQIIDRGRISPGTEDRIVFEVLDGDYKLDKSGKPRAEGYGKEAEDASK